ncbi:hypothetical protein [Microbispora sp. NPDC049125]|uniref:hypothetical protein n=1 Tax=Microbispora sp. NPDC049125 TaxID=3154929 RepID=UPI00346744FD
MAAIAVVLLSATSCGLSYMADPEGVTMGVGLTADGQVQVFVPLCPGQRVSAVEVREEVVSATEESPKPPPLLWRATGPVAPYDEGLRFTVLKDVQFATVEKTFSGSLPSRFGVYVEIGSHREGLPVDRAAIPKAATGTGMLALDNPRIAEDGVVSEKDLVEYTRRVVC